MEKHESDYNMIDWWKKVLLKNYANFQGRARRSEYWYFVLFNIIVIIPFYVIGLIGAANDSIALTVLGFGVYGIVALASLVPSLAVVVRRLHDTNRSGWYYFIGLIPLVGGILLLVWMFTEGDRFQNNYGDDPKNPGIPELEFTGQ
ncbi:MAG: DUF805 domain-containing protein [Lacibacter sp.]